MKGLSLLSLFFIPAIAAAQPRATVVFPPDYCVAGEERVITWKDGARTTYCRTGQEVLDLAIPGCQPGQYIVRGTSGERFKCKDIPACGAGEMLKGVEEDGQTILDCASMVPPPCQDNEVLRSVANHHGEQVFRCISIMSFFPLCGDNEYLTVGVATGNRIPVFRCRPDQAPPPPDHSRYEPGGAISR